MLRSNNILNYLDLKYTELSIVPNVLNYINSSRIQITNYQHLCLTEVQGHYHLILLLKINDHCYYNTILRSNQILHTLKFSSN